MAKWRIDIRGKTGWWSELTDYYDSYDEIKPILERKLQLYPNGIYRVVSIHEQIEWSNE